MANILFQWLSTGIVALLHPFFVSVIDINHNPKEGSVEISVRAFAEDIEKTVQKYTTKKIDLLSPADAGFLDSQIGSYISQKIRLKVNGQPVVLKYLGHELQKESIWMYLEVPKIADLSSLELDCKLLYDFEVNQTNLVNVKSKGVSKSYKLDYPKNVASFSF
jgi:hypothetical protein